MKLKDKLTRNIMIAVLAVILAVIVAGCQFLPMIINEPKSGMTEQEVGLPLTVDVDTSMHAPFPMENFNTVEFGVIDENVWKNVKMNPFSTFAADVDTASYATVRRYLLKGELPPKDAVRVEELINYFKYDYPGPKDGEPFGVNLTLTDTPWNDKTKLLVVGVQAEPLPAVDRQPSNLVFLIDVSGSMWGPDKLDLVKRSFLLLTEQLGPEDTVSIVTYAGSDTVLADGVNGSEKTEIMSIIENLEAGGSTHGSKGIITAYELAAKHYDENKNNRVILATDGDLNVGITSEGELTELIKEKKETGVFLSVMGFGLDNLKDNKLVALANNGNGNYGYIDSLLEAKKHLVEDMGGTLHTVAKDVKFQVEFNPNTVKGYRLIGYEDRLLNPEDFDDDKKDGGEIGAGHRVTIIYEIADLESEQEIPEVKGRYEHTGDEIVSTFDDELLTVSIRYKEPTGDESSLLQFPLEVSAYTGEHSQNMKLATALAEFGMLLRDSEFKGTATYQGVIDTLNSLEVKDDYINELIFLVTQAKRLAGDEPIVTPEPGETIDELTAIRAARTYIMEFDLFDTSHIDLNIIEVKTFEDGDILAYDGSVHNEQGVLPRGSIAVGDYLVIIGDTSGHDFMPIVVSGTTGEVIGFFMIE